MSRPIYIFACGGTGGHLYPGLAVVDALREFEPAALAVFVCSQRAVDRDILSPTDVAIVPQPILPMTANPTRLLPFLSSWRKSRQLADCLLNELKPQAVLGLGGFASGPMLLQAAHRGLPTALLNPDITPGKANRFLSRKVQAIFTQFDATTEAFKPHDRDKVHTVGCPVRASLFRANRDQAIAHFGLDPNKQTLFVFGGSTLADSLVQTVLHMIDDWEMLAETWQILMPIRPEHVADVQAVFARSNMSIVAPGYCNRMDLAWAATDFTLCRGGAVTIAELTACNKPAVIMPYPHHKDRQQYGNAEKLRQAGAAIIVDDTCDPAVNAQRLRETLLMLLGEAGMWEAMKCIARDGKVHSAAQTVAQWLRGRTVGDSRFNIGK